MAQYKTTNGRPVSFKFGPVTIRVGKKPAEIDSKYADRILEQYPGWIEKVGPTENIQEKPEAAATAETATEQTGSDTSTQEAGATLETAVDDQPKAVEPDPVPAETPAPPAEADTTPPESAKKKKSGKKSAANA